MRLSSRLSVAKTFLKRWETVVGIAFFIMGIPGMIDDLNAWGAWIAGVLPNIASVRWNHVALLIGAVLVGISAIRLRHDISRPIAKPLMLCKHHFSETLGGNMLYRQMARAGNVSGVDPASIPEPMTCPECGGNATYLGKYPGRCKLCEGTGELPGEWLQQPLCKACGGSGRREGKFPERCSSCQGYGRRLPGSGVPPTPGTVSGPN